MCQVCIDSDQAAYSTTDCTQALVSIKRIVLQVQIMHLTHVANVESSTKGPDSVSMYKMAILLICQLYADQYSGKLSMKLYNAKTNCSAACNCHLHRYIV